MIAITSLFPRSISYAQPEIEGAGENSSDSATTDELRKRIERVVEERREQIKGVVEDLLVKKGAYIGEITRISEEAITIKSNDNPNIIPLTDQLVILKGNAPASINAIEVGNWAVVMGNRSDNTIEPEYVLVSATTLRPMNQFVRLGSIKAITRSDVTFIPRGTQDEQKLAIQKTTKYEDADGLPARIADFDEELNVLVTAVEGKDSWQLKTMRSLAPLTEEEK
jgi:hypothetical protein